MSSLILQKSPCPVPDSSAVIDINLHYQVWGGSMSPLHVVQDQVDTIRSICIGISAHQKLELLSSLVKLLGYESLAVFGDCFDEVSTQKCFCNQLNAGSKPE